MDDNWNGAFLYRDRHRFDVFVWVEISDHPLTIDASIHNVKLSVQIGEDIIEGWLFCLTMVRTFE